MRDHLKENQMEDSEEVSSMGLEEGAVRETHQTISESEQRDRQEEDWSIPASLESRDDSPVSQGLKRTPPTPPPSEERLFTDWSSLESPHARTSPQRVPIRETGQNVNQPDNQTTAAWIRASLDRELWKMPFMMI